ncbi:MAG: hypothetical protein IJ751_02005, partial [Oscillospiraceae bacterium]|nr:hypothetical protein [Oscillospiraceae bacterium]
VVWSKACKECGESFCVTRGELDYLLSLGMEPPKRCQRCLAGKRKHPGRYDGLRSTFAKYPPTRGHRNTVHGGD